MSRSHEEFLSRRSGLPSLLALLVVLLVVTTAGTSSGTTQTEVTKEAMSCPSIQPNQARGCSSNPSNCCPSNNPNCCSKFCPNGNCTVAFKGFEWWTNFHCNIRTGPYEPINGVGQIWDPKLVTVDRDGLRLQVAKCSPDFPRPTPWCSTEVVLLKQTGFGKYLVTVKGDGFNIANLATTNPALVAGAFTYQVEATSSRNSHQELDTFEIGKLQANNSTNAQFTLQPAFANPNNIHRITMATNRITASGGLMTFVMDWKGPGRASFAAYYGAKTLATLPPTPDISWTPSSAQAPFIPTDACQHFHLNFWQFAEHAKGPKSILVTNFEFQAH